MNDYPCSEVQDLLPGYAADALDEDERCAVATHLAECRNHDGELSGIRLDFERVAIAAGPVQPPARLRAGLLEAFDRELSGNVPAPPAPTHITAAGRTRGRHPLLTSAGLGYALAASLLILAVGLGAWGLSRGGGDEVTVVATREGTNSLQLTYIEDQQLAVLDVELAAPPEGQTYQAWQIVDGAPVSIGILNTSSGHVAFSADLRDASAIALSVEPMGGSQTPTTTPILVTALDEG